MFPSNNTCAAVQRGETTEHVFSQLKNPLWVFSLGTVTEPLKSRAAPGASQLWYSRPSITSPNDSVNHVGPRELLLCGVLGVHACSFFLFYTACANIQKCDCVCFGVIQYTVHLWLGILFYNRIPSRHSGTLQQKEATPTHLVLICMSRREVVSN